MLIEALFEWDYFLAYANGDREEALERIPPHRSVLEATADGSRRTG